MIARFSALLLLMLPLSCVANDQKKEGRLVDLPHGASVELKGSDWRGEYPLASEVEELTDRTRNPRKFEVSAQVDASEKGDIEKQILRVAGRPFQITKSTKFEDADKTRIDAFQAAKGSWVKIKAQRSGDQFVARAIRKIAPRERFKIEGIVSDVDAAARLVRVAQLPVYVDEEAKFHLLGIKPDDPLALFLDDEQKGVPFTLRIGENLRAGGELAFNWDRKEEFDFDKNNKGNRDTLNLEAKADLLWRFHESGSFALFEASAVRSDRFREDKPDTYDRKESISRAFAYLRLSDSLRLIVGRQDFDVEREWLYDEVMDGVRASFRVKDLEFEASASWGREFLEQSNPTEKTSMYVLLGRAFLSKSHSVTAYFLQKKDTGPANFEPWFLGVRSYSKPWKGLGHWLEFAQARGYSGLTRIEGRAIDVGGMYRFGGAARPTIAVGYALGQGSSNPSNHVGFRQTGIQDNNGKFGSVTSFRYYGEVFDPELSNLEVWTLGLGVRPWQNLSFDLVWHRYRQDKAQNSLAASDLKISPNGIRRDLGEALDFILGHRLGNRSSFEFVASRFDPGSAFTGMDPAFKAELTFRWKF